MLDQAPAAGRTPANRKERRAARRKAGQRAISGRDPRTANGLAAATNPDVEAAIALIASGDNEAAELRLRAVIAAQPDCAEARFWLGCLGMKYRQFDGAYEMFKCAVSLDPGKWIYWREFAHCLRDMSQYEAAAIALNQAIGLAPLNSSLHVDLGWVHVQNGNPAAAFDAFATAAEIDPGNARAHFASAAQHNTLGQRDRARELYRRTLEADPEFAAAYFALVDLVETPEEVDALIARAERIVSGGRRPADERAKLQFAVARGHRRRKRYGSAFASYTAANDTMKGQHGHDPEKTRRFVDSLIEAFRPETFETLAAAGSDSRVPVFIVGMPRSGSTLAEQILSSHPDIADAGEFWKMPAMVWILRETRDAPLSYPGDIARFDPARLRQMGEDYLDTLKAGKPPAARRITDKMLGNAFNLGLIAILFPEAAIIHCRRDPMDTCLSCYCQAFADGDRLAYTFDQRHLGLYYREYERLMEHWREVLPSRLFELDYENMVANQEAMSRKLIEHIGLPWDDACLAFHDQERVVRTASLGQVRKPVYGTSVGAWRHFEAHLEPLKQALGVG